MATNIFKSFSEQITGAPEEKQKQLRELFPQEFQEWESKRPVNVYLNQFITTYKHLLRVKDHVRILSETDDPVLISGPTGTGKELLARALHGDRTGQFVDVNCAGIPSELIESELFGHVKGAFTGAITDKVGLMQAAVNGTLFMDEIGELKMEVQAKLLRAVQFKEIRRVGADLDRDPKPIKLHCRFVFATHRDILRQMVPAGNFREDLYWRISKIKLEINSISERSEDIKPIIKKLIMEDKGKVYHDIEDLDGFCSEIIKNRDKLSGNVRQLENMVRNWHLFGMFPSFD